MYNLVCVCVHLNVHAVNRVEKSTKGGIPQVLSSLF